MRRLALLAALAVSGAALANGPPPLPAGGDPSAAASAAANASSSATGGASSATSGHSSAANGSMYGGDSRMYILPAPVGGSNLPAGMCQRSSYSHFAVGWNLVSVANGQSHTDMECLELLVRLEALRKTPAAPVVVPASIPPSAAAPPPKACQPKPRPGPKKPAACQPAKSVTIIRVDR